MNKMNISCDSKIWCNRFPSIKYKIRKIINKLSIKEIVNLISQNNSVPKKKIYNFCLKLKNEG